MIVDFWLITTDANSVPKSADALPALSTSANVVSLAIVPASTGVYSVRATLMDDAVIASALIAWDVDTVGYVKHVVISRATELGALVGPFTRTITVTDSVSGDPIEGVSVRFSLASDTESRMTDASGVASFTVSAGTWSYEVFRSGYAGASGTVVVSEDGDTAVALVAISTNTPLTAPLTSVLLPTEDQYGSRRAGVTVKFTFLSHAEGATITGTIVNTPGPRTSDSDGICRVTLRRLANYKAEYTIPGDRVPKVVNFTTGDTGTDTIVG